MQPAEKSVKSKQRKKWYYSIFTAIAAVVVFCTVYALILPAITLTTQTTGAQTNCALSYTMYSNPSKTYRAYLEYSIPSSTKNNTFGVLRQSVIYVYANAGETICLGSDIVHSRLDINDKSVSKETGADIVVIGPDGTKYVFDNDDETGIGYIGTPDQEKYGANYEGSGNTQGYTPHEFYVRNTGVYEIRFHSFDGKNESRKSNRNNVNEPHLRTETTGNCLPTDDERYQTVGATGDPAPYKLTDDRWANTGVTVGAFDATVVKDGEIKTGRAYADYLALNMGTNTTSSFHADFYMVTSDGYIYRSKYTLDPFGFIFFANSRGVVDTDTGYSAYHSVRANGQISGSAEMDIGDMHYTVFTPQNEGTVFDKTYQIFFEKPDEALTGILFQRAFAPEKVENIEFIGSKEGNITYVGNGGYFKFDVVNSTSVSITISFSEYDETYEDVTINANVTDGTNYVYWDGKDANGVTIPEGWYKSGKIHITVNTHTGEIHFPYLDVENGDGVSFERVNKIYDYVDGQLTDVTDQYESSRFLIYYDNTTHFITAPDPNNPENTIQIPDNNPKYNATDAKTLIADNVDASNGVNSESLQMYWRNTRGDYSILDVWTYAVAEQEADISTDIIVEDLDGYYTVNLKGLVFFDKDESTLYDVMGGDYPLSDVKISLDYYYCGTRWMNIEKDQDGNVTKLMPAAHYESVVVDGVEQEVINYYYHSYEVHLEEDGEYHLYQYAFDDYTHQNDPLPALDKNGNPIIVNIEEVITEENEEEEQAGTISYKVWIPVHRETTTEALGEFFFSGILVNENMFDPLERDENDPNIIIDDSRNKIIVTVTNPDPDLFMLTTANAHTGDFDTNGTEVQELLLTDLYELITRDLAADPDRTNFFYEDADVGYFYETYQLNVVKRWGSLEDSNNVEEITFHIQGYTEDEGGNKTVCYTRDVKVDYRSWMKQISDLPAYTKVGNQKIPLKYRISSEMYQKNDGFTYIYTYPWDSANPVGRYEKVLTFNEDGTPATKELLREEEHPYETYIFPLTQLNTGDYIYVENWSKQTTTLKITKYGANDNETKLANATFKLQKLDTERGVYVDVETLLEVYKVTTDSEGFAEFRGLGPGHYKLVEDVAPELYTKAGDIEFEISEDNTIVNTRVQGDYENGYTVDVYDDLAEAPVSTIVKYDQYGNAVTTGATFEVYGCDENYQNVNESPTFTLTTGEDGTAPFLVTLPDGTQREMYLSEFSLLLGDKKNFILRETGVPDGYRKVGEAHLKIVGSGLASYVVCENPYQSGVWANPNALVYSTEVLQMVNTSDYNKLSGSHINKTDGTIEYINYLPNGQISPRGTLFAVVLKRDGAEPNVTNLREVTGKGWNPVYGDDINGYHVISNYNNTVDAVIEVIENGGATAFEKNANNNQMYAQIVNLPGYPTDYYTYYFDNRLPMTADKPQYLVAYYYTTAQTLEEATKNNTVQVRSHGMFPEHGAGAFDVHWSTTINVPDIANSLYVQKRDVKDNLVNNAVFGLYNAVADSSGKSYYVGEDSHGDTVYIDLTEDDSMTANVYKGTVSGGVLTITQHIGTDVTYTTNPDDYLTIDRLGAEDDLKLDAGYVKSRSGADVGVITVDDGNYKIKPTVDAQNRSCVVYTHDSCDAVNEYGTAHLRYLYTGKYVLREIGAPPSFKLNNANTEVVVDNNEVYANAGGINDGVRVGNGAGYLVSTMNVFGSVGDISESLSYIVGALRLDDNISALNGFTDLSNVNDWEYISLDSSDTTRYIFSGNDPASGSVSQTGEIQQAAVLYLKYNGYANHDDNIESRKTIFDYTYNDDDAAHNSNNLIKSIMLWTESGWSDLAIFQHISYAQAQQALSNGHGTNTTFTDISAKKDANGNVIYKEDGVTPVENDISYLFSSSTFVSVEDQTSLNLKLNKVSATTNNPLMNARFVMYRYEGEDKYYYSEDEDGNPKWITPSENLKPYEYSVPTDRNGSILYKGLGSGEYYFEEIEPPDAFFPLGYRIRFTIRGDNVSAVKDTDGTPLSINPNEYDEETGIYSYSMRVPNNSGYILPETGGNALLYYTFGTLLTVAGVFMCGYKLRRKEERRAVD